MNAGMEQTDAAGMLVVLTPKDHTPVTAILVSMVTECHVVILMSAHRVSTTVIRKRSVLIQKDHIAVLV